MNRVTTLFIIIVVVVDNIQSDILSGIKSAKTFTSHETTLIVAKNNKSHFLILIAAADAAPIDGLLLLLLSHAMYRHLRWMNTKVQEGGG